MCCRCRARQEPDFEKCLANSLNLYRLLTFGPPEEALTANRPRHGSWASENPRSAQMKRISLSVHVKLMIVEYSCPPTWGVLREQLEIGSRQDCGSNGGCDGVESGTRPSSRGNTLRQHYRSFRVGFNWGASLSRKHCHRRGPSRHVGLGGFLHRT